MAKGGNRRRELTEDEKLQLRVRHEEELESQGWMLSREIKKMADEVIGKTGGYYLEDEVFVECYKKFGFAKTVSKKG
jgi:hypothetical protein